MNRLDGLNNAQREAVLATEGPLLVLAGAGAGKTRVIVERILEIIRKGAAPEQILAITFTNKAASEMRGRVIAALDPRRPGKGVPFVSTFHSLGLAIIKENFRLMRLRRAPVIYDRADSLREMKLALASVGVNTADGEIDPRSALGLASRQKGDGVSAEEFVAHAKNPRERLIASAWLAYERALAAEGAMDFDDLLLRSVHLLRAHPEVRERLQQRWPYIHVDEYQDTNRVQAEMVGLLVGSKKNICAVGDIDQTIYGWRGAQIANMLSFEKSFPGARVIVLEENYRSTQNILLAANETIAKNVFRREKNLFTKNGEGDKLSLYQAFDETDEAAFIARKIGEMREQRIHPREIVVLYRANFQSRAIEEQLLAAEIPYQVVGTKFFERKEVKDVLSFIRAGLYGTSADIVRAVQALTRGIGKVTLLKMLAGREHELAGAVQDKVLRFRALLARIADAATRLTPSALIIFVLQESGMEKNFKEDKFEGAERLLNVRELCSLATRFDEAPPQKSDFPGSLTSSISKLEKFLESAALASDQDELKEEQNAVRLMTVHAAKGLEFRRVFITGLEEGLFPYERDADTAHEREEERRLMYVALTRAKEKVYLTYASYRTLFGSKNATVPSQFLSDIPDHLIELESPERLGKTIYLD